MDCASSACTSEQPELYAPMDADFGSKLADSRGRFPLFSLKPRCKNTSQKTPARTPPLSKDLGRELKESCRLNCNFQSSVDSCHENQPQFLRCQQQ